MSTELKPRTFLELLDVLTKETHQWVKRDVGMELKTQDGLLQQLRAAVFADMNSTGGSSSFSSRSPIDAGAVDLLEEITDQATQVLALVSKTVTPYGHAEHYVRLWAGQTFPQQSFKVSSRRTVPNAEQIWDEGPPYRSVVETVFAEYTAEQLLFRWVTRVESFFNPPVSAEIPAPCPYCEARYVYRTKDGHTVRSSALNFSRDRTTGDTLAARCSECGVVWNPSQFEMLAKMVGAKPLPELSDETPKENVNVG